MNELYYRHLIESGGEESHIIRFAFDDSFKKIVITKNGLNPMYDDQGILTIDLFDFLLGEYIF